MTLIPAFLLIFLILLLFGFSIKWYFDAKKAQSQETSNAPIKKAIGSLLLGFVMMVGIGPTVLGLVVQAVNQVFGWQLKLSSSNEVLGIIAFVVFCLAIAAVIFFYYNKRHKMYVDQQKKGEQTNPSISNQNQINNSQIIANSIDLGNKMTINNNDKVDKQINIDTNNGSINF